VIWGGAVLMVWAGRRQRDATAQSAVASTGFLDVTFFFYFDRICGVVGGALYDDLF
jgi:hypothetical protein